MIDKDKMEEQELKDFQTTEKIMHKIFKTYKHNATHNFFLQTI